MTRIKLKILWVTPACRPLWFASLIKANETTPDDSPPGVHLTVAIMPGDVRQLFPGDHYSYRDHETFSSSPARTLEFETPLHT